jgi:hypothetical protein
MTPFTAVLVILAVFMVLAMIIAKTDGLAFLAPKSTRAIRASAETFCTDGCRVNGRCPMTGAADRAADCPLFKYVGADLPTVIYGSPFEPTLP